MSKRPLGEPQRWTEGGAHDALTRQAADLFKVPPPSPLGALRREQIAHRLVASAVPVGIPLLAKVSALALIATGVAVGVVRSGSRPEPQQQPKIAAVAKVTAAAPGPLPASDPVPTETARGPEIPEPMARRSPIPAPLGRSETPRAVIKIATNVPSRPAKEPALRRAESAPSPGSTASAPTLPPSSTTTSEPTPPGVAPRPPPPPQSTPRRMVVDEYEAPAPPQRSEARLLADALASLHVEGDAKAALDLLAEHRKRFPRGALRAEALTAEVEALLSLDRRSEALRVLDGMVMQRSPRGHDLGVLRGELRAQAGQYRDAIADFNRCTSDASCGIALEERALFGRASCHKKLGELAAARADLEAYLRRFPHGQRSEAVRRALTQKE
jgi:hypothetical protein